MSKTPLFTTPAEAAMLPGPEISNLPAADPPEGPAIVVTPV